MSKAEERALEKYPKATRDIGGIVIDIGYPQYMRDLYIEGYHQSEKDLTDKAKVSSGWDGFYYGQGYEQAEKDLELTWEDISKIINIDQQICGTMEYQTTHNHQQAMEEVLKRFKEWKEK